MKNRSFARYGHSELRAAMVAIPLLLLLSALPACGSGNAGAPLDTEEHAEGEEHGHDEGDVVRLDSTALAIAGFQIGTVETVETTGLSVTGTITHDANRVSHVGPRIEGRIVALRGDLGQRVQAGQALAVLESAEVGRTRAEEQEAEALVRIARENYQRELDLEAQGIISRKELLQAEAELRRAEASLQSARERLRVLGASQGRGGQFAVTAPFSGVVVSREAGLGEVAGPADRLFTVADLSRLWIELDIFERDLARVAQGQGVEVSTAAYPGRTFPGTITYIGDILDPLTRTVRARVEVPNPGGALRPGMFATATIRTGGGTSMPVVPRQAVQDVEGRSVVWVPGDHPGEFRAQPVEVGEAVDRARVVIRAGLQPGDRVVTEGAFTLKAELSRGEFGDGHVH